MRVVRIISRLFLGLCLCLSSLAIAQTITGSVTGVVTDPSGSVIPGGNVTVVNVATGVSSAAVTNEAGIYYIQYLRVGSYKITISAPGFTSQTFGPFNLEINQLAKIDAKLSIGSASEVVTVTEKLAPILNAENSTIASTITANTIENTPINGQNFATLSVYMPGAVTTTPSNFGKENGTERAQDASSEPAFNGNRQQTNNFILDGVEINETMNNAAGYNPSPEAIQEVQVVTANANAEYGNANGGSIVVVLKSGTNQFHGRAFGFLQDDKLDANTWEHNFQGIKKSQYTQSLFGGTFGGPIVKNKLFFFMDYEGMRYHSGGQKTFNVAPAAYRTNGIWSGSGASSPVTITNPVATYLFAHPELYPLPNKAATDGLAQNNYQGSYKQFRRNDQGDVKIDYKLGDRDSLMGRFSIGNANDGMSHDVIPILFPGTSNFPYRGAAISWVHTFPPAIVNEARIGFSRTFYDEYKTKDESGVLGKNGNATVGIPGGQQVPGFSYMLFNGGDISSLGSTAWMISMADNNFVYTDHLTWQKGRHLLKLGADFVRYQQNFKYPGDFGALGEFSYTGQYTGSTFADFVEDKANFKAIGAVTGYAGQRQWRDGIFVQDDWKLLPNLTLNIGLRWEYYQPIYEVNDKQLNVDPTTMTLQVAGQNHNSRALYNATHDNFLPRVGFAYQPSNRWVIRAGYGITESLEGTGANLRLTQNYPYSYSVQVSAQCPASNPGCASSETMPLAVGDGFTSSGLPPMPTYYEWDKNLRPAFIQNYNLTVEYQLANDTSLRLGYVGEKGTHLIDARWGNQWKKFNDATTAPYANLQTPFGLLGSTGTVKITESQSQMNYNSMQAVLRHHASHGMEYTVNYTYAKALTDNPGFYGTLGITGPSPYWQNAYDRMGDYGPAGYDVRHSLSATGVFELPFGRGKRFGNGWNGIMDQTLGGWKIGGTGVAYTGFPVTITSWGVNSSSINGSGAAYANRYRPLHIVNRSVQHWFGTDPSAVPCGLWDQPDNGTCAYGSELDSSFGTGGNGTERAPGYRQVDLSLFKSLRVIESQRIEFRTDFFNAFNIASYGNPNSSVEAVYSATGTETTTQQMGTFGQITGTRSPQRQIQFALKYIF